MFTEHAESINARLNASWTYSFCIERTETVTDCGEDINGPINQSINVQAEEEEEEEYTSRQSVSCLQCVSGVRSIHRGEVFRAAACCSNTSVKIGREPAADLTLTTKTLRSEQHNTMLLPHNDPLGLCGALWFVTCSD